MPQTSAFRTWVGVGVAAIAVVAGCQGLPSPGTDGAIAAADRSDQREPIVVDAAVESRPGDVPVVPPPPAAPTIGYDPQAGAKDPVDSPFGGKMYFIATDGADTNTGVSITSPWKTLNKANGVVKPGDIVYVRGGVHYQSAKITASGTAAAPITWRSYPGEWAVIDGGKTPAGTGTVFRMVAARWNIVRSFEIRNADPSKISAGLALFDCEDNVLENLLLHHNHGNGQSGENNFRNRFSHCTAHSNADQPDCGNADGFGMSLGGGKNVYEHCEAYGNSDDGFDFWESVSNVVISCASHGNGWFKWSGGSCTGNGNGFKLGGATAGGGHLIRGSIAFGNRVRGIDANSGSGNLPLSVLNNTAYNNPTYNFSLFGAAHVARNNLAYVGGHRVDAIVDDTYNSWNLTAVTLSGADFVSLDPANLQTTFLRLAAGSDAIDKGTSVGLPYSGTAPDLGAFEK